MAVQDLEDLMIKIGDLRHRITFEKEVKVPDGYKGNVITWQPVCVVWASVEPLSSREKFYAHQTQAETTHRVKIRYREGLTEPCGYYTERECC